MYEQPPYAPATSQELLAQAEELKRQAAEVRKQEIKEAVDRIKSLMAEHGITRNDLKFNNTARAKGSKRAPKYRDPATGKTWAGCGKMPVWARNFIAQGNSLEAVKVQ